ncbi:glycosyltransferase [Sunxiuqinia elliptica]|uniref:Glycosyltransferase involved in cell wall biosynthesis n=1 Tax=Sunxiuqinia elliptica TaxID=655355 RepID=A0A4R6GM75_9BACT|nr:glycosyltransferase [Sunxiuqinia elliptica]TDN96186.1 glycosyltransferase involved in cell wall biosynthesis [Sunxiuqinia elliptica]TDO67897.1 glycosyltransferase involved in cell wall biosynthesis [Sunxiuqinia elliptica]
MKVLMFGWEFPPHISGGLGTACYGITKSLSNTQDVQITFVIPKAYGNEPKGKVHLVGANEIDLIKSKIHQERLQFPIRCYAIESGISPYTSPTLPRHAQRKPPKEKTTSTFQQRNIPFSGAYGPNLMQEIHNFSVIAEYLASQTDFDLIHAHDWLTFPAGIAAKKMSGKPLVIHVHATEFDRSHNRVNPQVFEIEQQGMLAADSIICVSNRTRQIVINNYQISADKCQTVHNGVEFSNADTSTFPKHLTHNAKLVTFLGRITSQKGPEYFIKLASLILKKMTNVYFCMAGNGDLYEKTICQVAQSHIADRFLFTGFLKGNEVCQLLSLSDIFIMPSISEPFGICPLEAMQHHVPTIISKQSGVSEVVKHTIKVDFWDIHAMADAVHALLTYPSLSKMMIRYAKQESSKIKWEDTAQKITKLYRQTIRA